ncbi:MAG: hypothetical protein F4W92_00540 [Gammaproteobacteria bacterium]|nr:hypothetical protein [Gammaproteobacteria bacterium]
MVDKPTNSKSLRRTYLVYNMYILGAFLCIPMFVGMVFASVEKTKTTDPTIQTHLKAQLRIFWVYLFSIFGTALVLISLYPIYVALAIVKSGAREVDPATTFLLATLPAIVIVLTVLAALMIYVLVSSIRGLRKFLKDTEYR